MSTFSGFLNMYHHLFNIEKVETPRALKQYKVKDVYSTIH